MVLSWSRPYSGVFRKYIVEMFYFNPVSMTSEWTPYYEIAATVSLTSTVVKYIYFFALLHEVPTTQTVTVHLVCVPDIIKRCFAYP